MPQMGESIAEGTVSKWLKQLGDPVERDEPILEISTDKVDAEIPAPESGTLVEVRIPEGETVEIGTVVAYIDTEVGVMAASASVSIYARTVPISAVSPSCKRTSTSVPESGAGISASTLSVEISRIGSSLSTGSPTCFSHFDTVPSAMDSPIWGMGTSMRAISVRPVSRSRRRPREHRSAHQTRHPHLLSDRAWVESAERPARWAPGPAAESTAAVAHATT